MAKPYRFTGPDRAFYTRVSRAALSNPFSKGRIELDQALGGGGPDTPRSESVDRVTAEVARQLEALDRKGRGRPQDYVAADADILRATFLFHIFHRHLDAFDRLIENEARSPGKPRAVPFARAALDELSLRGFSPEESIDYFGLFYQIRRAYYLIYRSLIGTSASMERLRLQLWQNVFTDDISLYQRHLWNRMEDFSTLLLGETGTGKGAAASAIGRAGFIPFQSNENRFASSFTDTFISINLSQFSEALLESELFGHRKGAFTGAMDHHDGILARCSPHGAIFLDEIGDVSTQAQIKLLKVLEDRSFSPVGSHDRIPFRGRIIAATHQDLSERREQGSFRDDFYYRLCSDAIRVPPLRQRIAEDPTELTAMIRHLVTRTVGEDASELVERVEQILADSPGGDYAWPGNVRELEQAVRRILLNRSYPGDLRAEPTDELGRLTTDLAGGNMTASTLLARYCRLLYRRHGSYVEVARRTELDRRTVKKYVETADE